MTLPSDLPREIEEAFALFFDNQATPEVCQTIHDWLEEDPHHAAIFAEYGAIERMIYDAQKAEDASAVFALLQEAEDGAEPMTVTLHDGSAWKQPKLTSRQWHSALAYVFDHTIHTKAAWVVAAAAAILLAVTLSIVFLAVGNDTREVADAPERLNGTPTDPTPDPNRVVATVTDQVNAQWVSANTTGVLPERMLLAANQRLTLAKGFAEITTLRGAKVLIQAPATIETTDSDNAIRLYRGKLVGRCETPSSKGFIVHTPGMDVVDLGTVFGVEADEINGTKVVVMEGSVRAEPSETSPRAFTPVVLMQDDARRVVPDTGALEMITVAQAPVFYEQAPHPYVQAVLDAEPLAYWRFEEDANKTVSNEIASGTHHLKITGQAFLDQDGFIGRAGSINRQAPYGVFEMVGSLDTLSQKDVFTFECWFRADAIHKGTLFNLYEDDPTEIKHIAGLELHPSNIASTGPSNFIRSIHCDPPNISGSVGTNLFSEEVYHPRVWHHVVVVKDLETLRLYLDGKQVAESMTTRDLASGAKLTIGKTLKSSLRGFPLEEIARPFQGLIDEAAVYNRALSEEEITVHWNAGNALESQP